MSSLRLSIVLFAIVGTAACSGMLDSNEPAARVYWLNPLVVQADGLMSDALPSLMVSIKAAPGMDTDRLLILESGARLNHYAAARWPDNAPDVLESLLRQTLESTGHFSRVSGGQGSHSADWLLELVLREFFAVARNDEVRITISGYVRCAGGDHAISLQAAASIDDERLGVIVAAHQSAIDHVSRQLANELSETCVADAQTANSM